MGCEFWGRSGTSIGSVLVKQVTTKTTQIMSSRGGGFYGLIWVVRKTWTDWIKERAVHGFVMGTQGRAMEFLMSGYNDILVEMAMIQERPLGRGLWVRMGRGTIGRLVREEEARFLCPSRWIRIAEEEVKCGAVGWTPESLRGRAGGDIG